MTNADRRLRGRLLASASLVAALAAANAPALGQSLPTGGAVASGAAKVGQSGAALTINQTSAKAVVNWNSYSVGAGATVTYVQPNAASATLNRVIGNTPSTVAGQINANGQVYLVNPNGIAITRGGAVNVGGGFVASTLGIADSDFNGGRLTFTGGGASAPVSNAGAITVGTGGFVGLLGGTVSNSGTIVAPLGKVGLGSGEQATLDPTGDGFLQVAMPTGASAADGKALVDVSGKVRAAGGTVTLEAATAANAVRDAINLSGYAGASSMRVSGGSVVLGGGPGGRVAISGRLSASGRRAGGSVAISGASIALTGGKIAAKGKAGAGGSVVIAATGAVSTTRATLDASGATAGGTVSIAAAGTIAADAASVIRADATANGGGGAVSILAGATAQVSGIVTALGGPSGGAGGAIRLAGPGGVQVAAGAKLDASSGAAGALGGVLAISAGDPSATSDGVVDISGTLRAGAAAGTGGTISVTGRFLLPSGTIDASGAAGGSIALQGRAVTQSGVIAANGATGAGGAITIEASDGLIQTTSAVTSANGAGAGGAVTLTGAGVGNVFTSGMISATGATGGAITLLGVNLTLAAATVDADGTGQGGTVFVGGGPHGAGANTAGTTLVNGFTTISADATATGDGGQIVIWSNQTTTFEGSASARGGASGGDGGGIEASSGGTLSYSGAVDVSAPAGKAGALLLDPQNIVISSSAGSISQYSLVDPDAGQGSGFGTSIVQLSGGTIVVTKPLDNVGGAAGAGSVFFYNSATGGLIASLQGSHASDNVGSGGLEFLNHTNYLNYYNGVTLTFVNDVTASFLILSPSWSGGAGAITWVAANSTVNGTLSSSNSLVGSTATDAIGSIYNIYVLPNNNYVNVSSTWAGGKGAVTLGTYNAGVAGVISASNSLVGSTANRTDGSNLAGDQIGSGYLYTLPNGNFVIDSPNWNQNAGAVTFIPETGGVTGAVGASNSLVGGTAGAFYHTTNGQSGSVYGFYGGDGVGAGITVLSNSYYVVSSTAWSHGKGAVTVGNPTSGASGTVSASNSLVGTASGAQYESIYGYEQNYGGDYVGGGVTDLGNGNFVVSSTSWTHNMGAATFMSSTSPLTGAVSSSNSLVGSTSGSAVYGGSNISNGAPDSISAGDAVGQTVTVLGNSNYVVSSSAWNSNRGAVTFGSGSTGIVGAVSSSNSLVGSASLDYVGSVTALADNDYVVTSADWGDGKGAVTRGSGTTGVAGTISSANSIVGVNTIAAGSIGGYNAGGDFVGSGGVSLLPNGDWVILSPNWGAGKGAVTLMTPSQATSGNISASNSLVGSNPSTQYTAASGVFSQFGGDLVGSGGIVVLSYGGGSNFLVSSPYWGTNKGAVTFEDPSAFTTGAVSSTNSLVGANSGVNSSYVYNGFTYHYWDGGDTIGTGGSPQYITNGNVYYQNLVVLPNDNYVVVSPAWNSNTGAVTLGNGSAGSTGVVASVNSLVGSTAGVNTNVGANNGYGYSYFQYVGGDQVGYSGVQELTGSSFVVQSPFWSSNKGAVTFSNGAAGFSAVVSSSNSLVGAANGDEVGYNATTTTPTTYPLTSGEYLVASPGWGGGKGAVTFVGTVADSAGVVSSSNSLVGSATTDNVGSGGVTQLTNNTYVILSPNWNGNVGAATWVDGGAITGAVSTSNSLTGPSAGSSGAISAAQLGDPSQFAIGFPNDGSGQVEIGVTDPTVFTYAYLSNASVTISTSFLTAALNDGTPIALQANDDITVNGAIVASGSSTASLTLDAGRSVLINAGINTGNGDLTIVANDTSADGVVNASRGSGTAAITISTGAALSTGTGALSITMNTGAGNTNSVAGNISVGSALSGATVSIENLGAQNGSVSLGAAGAITAAGTGNAVVIETGGAFINSAGASALTASAGRWLVYSASPGVDTLGGLTAPNTIYNSTPTSLPPASVSQSGNALIYASADPNAIALTIDISNQSTTYGSSFTLNQSSYVEKENYVAGNYVTLTGFTISAAGASTGALSAGTAGAGGYTLNGTTPTNSGYSFTIVPGALTVQPYALTYSVANANATYGTTATLGTATLSATVNGDSVTGTVGAFTGSTPVTLAARTAAGAYTEEVTGLSNANYSIAPSGNTNGTLTIAPLALTYSVANANATYGTTATLGAATLTGVLGGDSVTGTVGAFTGSTPVALAARTAAGAYTEEVTGLSNANYSVAPSGNANGTLTIAPLALTYSVANANSTYGTTATLGSATLTGVLGGDSVTGTVAAFIGSTPVVLASRTAAGAYTEEVTGLSNANYSVAPSGNTNGTLTIAPLALTYSVANANSTYGTTATLGAATLTGVLGGDSVTGTVAAFQGSTPVVLAARTAAGSYAEVVTGLSNANYAIAANGNTNGTLTIAPLALTYSVGNANSTYGTIATLGSATLNGVLGGDSVTGTVGAFQGSTPVALAARTAAGAYTEEVTGVSNANYTIAPSGNTNGTLTIAPLALTYSVADANSTYGTTATLGAATLTGVLGGDSVTGTVAAFQGSTPVVLAARTAAGSYAEEVTGLSNANYAIAANGNTNGTLTIAPLALTYSVANANSTYATIATLGSATLNGVLGGDSVTGTVGAFQGSTPVVLAARTAAGAYTEEVTGVSNANYTIAPSGNTNGTLTIAPLALTYSVADANSTYGTAATLGAATLNGVLGGDSVTGTVGAFQGSTPVAPAARTGAGVYTEEVTGVSNANYTIAPSGNTNGTLTIAPLALTYSVADANSTYGTTATLGSATLNGVLGGDSVTGTVGAFTGSTPVALAARTGAGVYTEEVTGVSSSNYTIAPSGNTNGTLAIAPLALTYSVADANSTYGTAATLGAATLTGVLGGDSVAATVVAFSGSTPVALAARTAAGVYSEQVTGLSNANYAIASSGNTNGTLTIAPLALTYSVADANSTYGTTATLGTATLTGALAGDSVTATVGAFSGSTPVALAARTAAGAYTEEATGLSNANYTIAPSGNANGTLTIAPLALTYSIADANSTYGTTATLGSATLNGVLGGDSVTATVGAFTGSTPVALAARTGAGSYSEAVTGLSNANYAIAPSGNTNGTLTIAPLALTYSVANTTVNATYGTPATFGAATLTGALLGDSVTATVGAFQGSTPVALTARTPAGTYAIEVGALSSANYTIAANGNTTGTLTIAPLALTYSVADANSTYGTSATLGTATLTGVLGGDSVTATVAAFQGSTPVALATNTPAAAYAEKVTGLSNANYTIAPSGNTNGTLTIAALALTYKVADANSTYGTSAALGAATLNGVLGGDSVTATVGAFQGSTPAALAARTPAGAYTEEVTGLSNANYTIAPSGNTNGTLTVAALALTYSVADANSTYGTTAALGNATLTGVLGGDSVTATVGAFQGSTPVTLAARSAAGAYSEAVTGLSNANYTIAPSGNTNGTLTIAPLALTYSVADANSTYGTSATLGTATLTGALGGDSVTATVGAFQGSTPVALAARTGAGVYTEEVTGLSNANYTIAPSGNTNGTLTIAPLALTYSVANTTVNATYGTAATLGSATLTGVLAGDSVTPTVAVFSGSTPVALTARTPAGTYAIEVGTLSSPNYTIAPSGNAGGTLTIAPLALTYSVANANATYGTAATLGTATLTGVIGGDSVTATVGAFQGSTPVALAARTGAGVYTEEVTGLSNANYTIAPSGNTDGTLTIAPLALTYSVANTTVNATYGTAATLGSATLTGVLGGDSVTPTVAVFSGSTPVALTAKTPAGIYAIEVGNLSNANYTIASTGNASGTLTIAPLALTYSVADANATYGTPGLGTATLTGVLPGDSVTPTVAAFSGSTPAPPATNTPAGSYAEKVTGLSNANYTIAPSGNTDGTLTIAPLALTYSVANTTVNATYGTAATLGTATLNGVLGGDIVTPTVAAFQGSTPVALTARTPAGTYAIEVGTLSSANYAIATIGDTTGTLTIAPLALTYSVANATSTYGTPATLGTATLTGVLPGDSVTPTVGLFAGATRVALSAQTPPGVYSQEVTLLSNSNYVVAPTGDKPGSLTIQSANSVSPAALVTFASLPFINYQPHPSSGNDFCGPQSVAAHLHEHGAVDFGGAGWSCH